MSWAVIESQINDFNSLLDRVETKLQDNSAYEETMQSYIANKENYHKLDEDLDRLVPFERRVEYVNKYFEQDDILRTK